MALSDVDVDFGGQKRERHSPPIDVVDESV